MKDPTHKNKGLHIIILGGTIDFESNTFVEMETKEVDVFVPRQNSIIPHFLEQRIKYAYGDLHFSRLDIVDSRDITKDHLKELIKQLETSPFKHIIVTMGTVDLQKIKQYVNKHSAKFKDKIVGFVGSRQPLSNYQSDGGFNLGFAIGKLQTLKHGIYTFSPDEIKVSVKRSLKNIVFIITGGTIESFYDPGAGQEMPYKNPIIPMYFERALGIYAKEPDLLFREVTMKDSRNLTQDDFSKLVKESKLHRYKKQIIVTGTYGLPDMSRRYKHLVDNKGLPENTYVFTGSMLPEDTYLNDGWYNLGYAIGKMNSLKNDVYASMHSWVTQSANVWKQLNEGRFLLHDKNDSV